MIPRLRGLYGMIELVNVSCWAPSADLSELSWLTRLRGLI